MDREQTEKERRKQIKKLLHASTPEQRKRIRKARREGRRLRKEVEKL